MKIGNNLKQYRLIKGLKQIDMANYLGVAKNTYSQYENDKRTPNLDTIIKIINILQCSFEDLIKNSKK